MSPEQVAGDRELIGPASDTYSLGVILYELLTGRLPFQGSMTSVLVQITTESPPPPSAQRPDLDPRLEVICLKALAKKPAERYASMGELAAALAECLDSQFRPPSPRFDKGNAGTPPAPPGGVSRRRWWMAAGGTAALVLLGTIIVTRSQQGTITVEVPEDNPTITVNGEVDSRATGQEAPAKVVTKKPAAPKPFAPPPPKVPSPPPTTPVSAAKPSADPNNPTSLQRDEVVKGRVDAESKTNKAHYWLLDLPAGEYKAVVDMERADRRNSNIQGEVLLLGPNGENLGRLGHFNEIDYRARRVFPLRLDKPLQGMVRVTADVMTDYHLGLFLAKAAVPTPFFQKTPKVTPLKLGETFAPPALDGSRADTCDAFCAMTLPAGDYKLTVDFRRVDGRKSNIQGSVQALTMDGMVTRNLARVNEIDSRAATTIKLALSEEQSLIFRLVAEQELEATFKVDRLQEE
jgi:hypothetical protein